MDELKLTDDDIRWLQDNFAGLFYDPESHLIRGELEFWARYDMSAKKVLISNGRFSGVSDSDQFIHDTFEIEVGLDSRCINGWPIVWETGGRHKSIAESLGIDELDLHFYCNGGCCLGIWMSFQKHLTIRCFILDLVVPFFLRVSYAERNGIDAARKDLWGEHSHGKRGLAEHAIEMLNIHGSNSGRNGPCPCNSGRKYKHCHWAEVEQIFSLGLHRANLH